LNTPESSRTEDGVLMIAVVEVESISTRLSPCLTTVPFTCHVTSGAASPLMGTVKLVGRPARTLMSFIASTSIVGATVRGRQVTDSEASDGSDGPALLTATTRNSYSSPSIKSGTVALSGTLAAAP